MIKVVSNEEFARRLKHYMDKTETNCKKLSEITGASYSTVTTWVRAENYPRIGKIELLANYFGCKKSDLIEENDDSELLSGLKLRLEDLNESELDLVNDIVTMLINRRSKR